MAVASFPRALSSSIIVARFINVIQQVKTYEVPYCLGPSATYDEATNTITPRTSRGTAAKNSMYHVTPGSIAHIASQVYYSLLVNTDFSKSTVVEIGQIYDTVYAVFEGKEPVMQEYAKELLQWWDNIIFPVSVTSTTVKGGSIARLEKHLKLMKENRADAA
ncbi:hypothetical protein EW145_g7112 [Phellinidium pouzarii]|uniref:Uncharacterized protein n=1 Tax=Phellinidium pouzarii TaxID=167371 RepID=A0A4S4KPJ9_9AGAM|nr:hypothetical protein EW145_g7112 [Phellinidium pouzarii]